MTHVIDGGLDEKESDKFIYMRHESDKTLWKIKYKAAYNSRFLKTSIMENPNSNSYGSIEENPIIIKAVDLRTIPFIIKYMEYFIDKPESLPPEQPLKNIHISVLLGDEYSMFVGLYDETDELKTKLVKLNMFIKSALYFDIKYLHKKLCAITASLLTNKSFSEIKNMN